MTLDPYRTLEIAPGASAAEIKRAYRRLAKEHHPDSGGPAELPRFLAIQAAYEMLTSGRALGPGFGPGASPGGAGAGDGGGAGAGPAWRADPARARATREAWRRGPRGRGTGEAESGGASGWPGTPGAPSGTDGGGGGARTRGTASAQGGPGQAGGPGGGGERPREGGRQGRGSRRKATPGSTTYDEAHHEIHEPGWTGSSWYGQTSGTYWTINPREYADPRKHGPEYLARARKAAQGGAATEDAAAPGSTGVNGIGEAPTTSARRGTSMRPGPAPTPGPTPRGSASGGTASPGRAPDGAPPSPGGDARPGSANPGGEDGVMGATHDAGPADEPMAAGSDGASEESRTPGWSGSQPVAGPAAPASWRRAHEPWATWTPGERRPAGSPGNGPRPGNRAAPAGRGGNAGRGANAGQGVNAGDTAAAPASFGPVVDLAGVVEGILRTPARPGVRLIIALAGWPPLGVAVTLLLGEVSGCARFAAGCVSTSSFTVSVLAAQIVILALLLLAPPLARLAALGSLATVIAALPAMAFLTAIGAPYSPQGGPASLLALLGVAWLVGLLVALRYRPAGGRDAGGGGPS